MKDVRNTPSLTRDGSPDSAISSNSSKWSVSSNISIMSRLSISAASESATTLGPVVKETVGGPSESVNSGTMNGVNDITTERTRAATPFIRTSAVANGSLLRHTGSLVTNNLNLKEECFLNKAKTAYVNSGLTSELVVHLYIIASCASSASIKVEFEVCYTYFRFPSWVESGIILILLVSTFVKILVCILLIGFIGCYFSVFHVLLQKF